MKLALPKPEVFILHCSKCGALYYAKREMTCNLPIVEKLVLQDMINSILVKMNASGDNFKGG